MREAISLSFVYRLTKTVIMHLFYCEYCKGVIIRNKCIVINYYNTMKLANTVLIRKSGRLLLSMSLDTKVNFKANYLNPSKCLETKHLKKYYILFK